MTEFPFGPFCLNTETLKVYRDGADVQMRPRAFNALRVLLTHPGAVVEYETMLREAWEGLHVTPHTVEVTLGEGRQHLGEYGRWIVHRGGCRFILEIPKSDKLVRRGWHFWNQRTRTGCE